MFRHLRCIRSQKLKRDSVPRQKTSHHKIRKSTQNQRSGNDRSQTPNWLGSIITHLQIRTFYSCCFDSTFAAHMMACPRVVRLAPRCFLTTSEGYPAQDPKELSHTVPQKMLFLFSPSPSLDSEFRLAMPEDSLPHDHHISQICFYEQ